MASLTRLDIEQWVGELRRDGVGAPTIVASYKALRRALETAVAGAVIGRNPASKIKTPNVTVREQRILEPDEVERIAQAMPERYRAMILFMAYTGLRLGETRATPPP